MQDTELKYTQKGAAVCSFALASNRFFKQDGDGKDGKEKANEDTPPATLASVLSPVPV